ncbi:MAG TPA: hypothetical protein DIC34_09085 [Treponema sp.]|nr:MAG: hypothetical protein A2001_10045 [Treponema sp. GWC1_61_84]HCM26681.1 hypothetical protein [Treponema sp.]
MRRTGGAGGSASFDYNAADRKVYEERIRDFLPDRIADIHTHVWLDAHKTHDPREFDRVVSWPTLVAKDNPIEDLDACYALLFPGKTVTPLIFSEVGPGDDIDAMNAYAAASARSRGYPALLFARPDWTGGELSARLDAGGFVGAKVYLSFAPAYLPREEIRIFDFLPPEQLHELDRRKAIVMLHIPRSGRLRDPVNIAQLMEIEANFPSIKLVVAHAGRAYCEEDLGDAPERLGGTRNLVFDFSANTNAAVFARLLRAFGPDRCLFGSDLPITRMRMRRICTGGRYVNLVPRGRYGDVSGDPNMAELDPPKAESLSLFLYEEILAIRTACEAVGLDRADVEKIFEGNAQRLIP